MAAAVTDALSEETDTRWGREPRNNKIKTMDFECSVSVSDRPCGSAPASSPFRKLGRTVENTTLAWWPQKGKREKSQQAHDAVEQCGQGIWAWAFGIGKAWVDGEVSFIDTGQALQSQPKPGFESSRSGATGGLKKKSKYTLIPPRAHRNGAPRVESAEALDFRTGQKLASLGLCFETVMESMGGVVTDIHTRWDGSENPMPSLHLSWHPRRSSSFTAMIGVDEPVAREDWKGRGSGQERKTANTWRDREIL
ncbi:hypothetical protein QBC39DRAFT_329667 [Podospora conica]|nr:hypothetical protein QBC39DRAFT_329667 [Schizothecium conicum]